MIKNYDSVFARRESVHRAINAVKPTFTVVDGAFAIVHGRYIFVFDHIPCDAYRAKNIGQRIMANKNDSQGTRALEWVHQQLGSLPPLDDDVVNIIIKGKTA